MPGIAGARAASTDATATVKVVPEVDLKVLDPIWTTALITATHAWLIYDTLFAPDREYQVRPQMVQKYERDEDGLTWRFKLRGGLGWHYGTAMTARDCVASLRRWAARATTGKVLMERVNVSTRSTTTRSSSSSRSHLAWCSRPSGGPQPRS